MIKIKRITSFVLSVLILASFFILSMNSCSSIYTEEPEITQNVAVEVDLTKEYFTEGNVVSKSAQVDGFVYKNSWIYVENQKYQKYVKTLSTGEKIYEDATAQRIVKLNTLTGNVSSVCLDPVCTHSPGSDCIMLAPDNAMVALDAVVGDWLMFSYQVSDLELEGYWPTVYAYNMLTGELSEIFDYDLSGTLINKISLRCVFGDKLYYTKKILDYSNTDYDPSKDIPLSEYEPETRTTFWEYNFETKKSSELFEVPNNYKISAITNKRFFFILQQGEVYSCNRDGSNMKREENFDFAVSCFCGNFAYYIDHQEYHIKIYDVATDTAKTVPFEYPYQQCVVTGEGIMINTFSTANEEYAKAMESWNLTLCMQLRYSGTAWIYMMDFDGSNSRLVYEQDDFGVNAACASEKYFCATVTYYNPETPHVYYSYLDSARHLINRTTGEITPVPLLELVLVEE